MSVVAPGCTRIDNALAAVPIFAFMRSAPSFDPYEHPLPAPPGSVPFESPNGPVLPPLEATEAALNAFAASPHGRNPLQPNDPAALTLGKVMYDRHCAVCHGATAAGNGPLVGPGKFPAVPSLLTAARSDGYVYAIIRAGRGLMPAYGARMTHIERWAVVVYVNSLRAGGAAAQLTGAPPAPGAPVQATPGAPQAAPTGPTQAAPGAGTPPAAPDTGPPAADTARAPQPRATPPDTAQRPRTDTARRDNARAR